MNPEPAKPTEGAGFYSQRVVVPTTTWYLLAEACRKALEADR